MSKNPPEPEVCRCYKHYCRICGAEHYIKALSQEFPKCCGKVMAYLGHCDAIPGRDETNMRKPK